MTITQIKTKLEANITNSVAQMSGDGCNCAVTIVSTYFIDMPLLARQRAVLAILKDEIKSGEIHALSVKAYTPQEKQ